MLFENLDNSSVQCLACPFKCKVKFNSYGVCNARKNVNGKLFLSISDRTISANIDPIEKKPLYHFLPGTQIFSIGTTGCNFRCNFCQNHELSQATDDPSASNFNNNSLVEYSPQNVVKYCVANSIPTIAFTYNEPTIFSEYAIAVMKIAKQNNIRGVYVTNGYMSHETIDYISNYIDAFNIDLKSWQKDFYKKICSGGLDQVLDTIKILHDRGKWMELTTLLIPDQNDSLQEITDITNWIKSVSVDIPWHISKFYPRHKMDHLQYTPSEKLYQAYNIAKEVGLNHVYLGNMADKDFSDTYCPNCSQKLIERSVYSVHKNFAGTKCPNCEKQIVGVWQ